MTEPVPTIASLIERALLGRLPKGCGGWIRREDVTLSRAGTPFYRPRTKVLPHPPSPEDPDFLFVYRDAGRLQDIQLVLTKPWIPAETDESGGEELDDHVLPGVLRPMTKAAFQKLVA